MHSINLSKDSMHDFIPGANSSLESNRRALLSMNSRVSNAVT